MALPKSDAVPCVILSRANKRAGWEFHTYTSRKSVAFRSAETLVDTLRQEDPKSQVLVVLRAPYDAWSDGKSKFPKPLACPDGFDLDPKPKPKPKPVKPVEPPRPGPSYRDFGFDLYEDM